MNKYRKTVIISVISVISVCIIIALFLSFKNNKSSSSSTVISDATENVQPNIDDKERITEAQPLPEKNYLKDNGFEGIMQSENLKDYFFTKCDINDNLAVYNYQKNALTSGERLLIKVKKETEDEYNSSLKKVETFVTDKGDTVSFKEVAINYVSDDFQINPAIEDAVNKGTAEVERGNSLEREIISAQRLSWYSQGYSYCIEARNLSFTKDDMLALYNDFIQ